MKPVATFQTQPRHFWAHVKLLSEGLGYSTSGIIKRYTISDLQKFLLSYGLSVHHLSQSIDANTTYGDLVIAYIHYRADVLEKSVEWMVLIRVLLIQWQSGKSRSIMVQPHLGVA